MMYSVVICLLLKRQTLDLGEKVVLLLNQHTSSQAGFNEAVGVLPMKNFSPMILVSLGASLRTKQTCNGGCFGLHVVCAGRLKFLQCQKHAFSV